MVTMAISMRLVRRLRSRSSSSPRQLLRRILAFSRLRSANLSDTWCQQTNQTRHVKYERSYKTIDIISLSNWFLEHGALPALCTNEASCMNITVFYVFILLLATGGIAVPAELYKIWRGLAVGPSMNMKLIIRDSAWLFINGRCRQTKFVSWKLSKSFCSRNEFDNPRCPFDFPGKHGRLISRKVQLETRLVVLESARAAYSNKFSFFFPPSVSLWRDQ